MKRRQDFGRLLGLAEVADQLGISIWTVRRWAAQKRFRTVRLGRRVLVPESEVRELVARNMEEAQAPKELRL